jgi:tetratricopeptide (TPR) repeat protein
MRLPEAIAGFVICAALVDIGVSQQSHTTVRHRRIETTENSPTTQQISEAEAEITKNNFAKAETLLQSALAQNPKDFQGWYDLGFVHDSLNKFAEAISDYKKSIELNPHVFESNLNLGLLFAQQGNNQEAEKYLTAATRLKPNVQPESAMERAWLALGKVLEDHNPQQALSAFREAAKVRPKNAEPHLAQARLLERQGQLTQARAEYKQASMLASTADDRRAALAGLVNTAVATNSGAEAESALREYLNQNPKDSSAHVMFGRLLANQDKKEEAIAELNQASGAKDPQILREQAQLLSELKRYDEAAASYQDLIQQNPKDAGAHHQYGVVLMQQRRFQEALPELIAAVKLDPSLVAAYGDLAVAASESKQYGLSIQALDARAKMVSETAATHFLRATAYDNLKEFPKATAEYKEFLASADGRYPEKEWQARHRLIAIEKLK